LRRSVQMKEKLLRKLIQSDPELKEQYAAKLQDVSQWNRTIQSANELAGLNIKIAPMLDRLETQLQQFSSI
jgi:hypothetical protein